jgi:hypothetical protein
MATMVAEEVPAHQTGWTGLIANLLKPNQGGLQL